MAQYGKAQYWEDRYSKDPEPFDWYQRWAGLKECVTEYVKPNHKILMSGCGNSRLSEEMYKDGFEDIHNVDISSVVINSMKTKYKDQMTYEEMDMRKTSFPAQHFNAVIDKGTLDSILCGEGSSHNAAMVLEEISRILKTDGVYICVSYGQPSYRLTYLQRQDYRWDVKIHTVHKPMLNMTAPLSADEKDNVHYIYVCVKMPGMKADGSTE
eukprot:GHVL01000347.1.p1 GENE.GHVL01000347.1~~GHVL01000347.1.p1  ORF type:complete len:211 (+),score=24.52 GHVL01000347.1:63-695(+)